MQDAPGLLRGINAIITGTLQVQDFTRIVVTGAVEDVLLRVSKDHGLDYSQLVAKYREDVVNAHASATGASHFCQGLRARGQKCSKRAVVNGFCQEHAAQGSADESKRRQVEAYKQRVVSCKPLDAVTEAVRDMSRMEPVLPACMLPALRASSDALDLL